LKINVEYLIGLVQEMFDSTADVKIASIIPYYKRNEKQTQHYQYCYRQEEKCDAVVDELERVLKVDGKQLERIARSVRHWEEKRGWQYCFPSEDHYDKIIKYISKNCDSSEIDYLERKATSGVHHGTVLWFYEEKDNNGSKEYLIKCKTVHHLDNYGFYFCDKKCGSYDYIGKKYFFTPKECENSLLEKGEE